MAIVIRAARLSTDSVTLNRARRVHPLATLVAANAATPLPAVALASRPFAGAAPYEEAVSIAERPSRIDSETDEETAPAPQLPIDDLPQARADVFERARADGHEEGKARGYQAGLDAAEAEFADSLDRLRRVIAAAGEALDAQIGGAEDAIVEIAFEAIGRMLGEALRSRDGIVGIVRQVVGEVRERESLVVRLAPADFAMLGDAAADLLANAGERVREIVPDERVVLGGCLIEAGGGTLDGRLETQLQRLREVLLAVRRARMEHGV